MMMKKQTAWLPFLIPLGGLTACQKEKPAEPNIILILADDMGCNDLTCYRQTHDRFCPSPPTSQTPNLDKMAGEGIRFTNFYCGAAVSSPSRAVLLTGRNATRLGIYNWIPPNQPMHLRNSEITIAELLKQKGYQTGHFGKWHLTAIDSLQPMPSAQGFDYSFWTHNNAEPSHKDPVNFYRNNSPAGPLTGYSCQLVVNEAIRWLSKRQKNKPFYINVWFNEPHEKCAAPDSLTNRHQYNKEYYGCIENMDIAIGKLMQYLKEEKLEKNTLIIFSSDNGSEKLYSNYPVKGKKGINLQGGVRVPFIVRWPGKFPSGAVCDAVGCFTDILPTIADITGIAIPGDRVFDGESLAAVFIHPADSFHRTKPIFFYRYFNDPICFLREDNWCLVGYEEWYEYTDTVDLKKLAKFKPAPGQPQWSEWSFNEKHMRVIPDQEPKVFELYDLQKDMYQLNNIASQYPAIVNQMKEKMMALKKEMITEGGDWYKNNYMLKK